MRFKPTLILFVIAAAGLAYFFLIEQPGHRDQITREAREQRITELTGETVRGLVIRRKDGLLTFVKADDIWRMSSPVIDQADQASVNVVIGSVINAEIEERFPSNSVLLTEYGLADPVATIHLRDSLQSDLLSLDVGDLNLTKSHCYTREGESNTVLLLPAGIRRYALRTVFEFREKKVTELPVEDAFGIAIESDNLAVSWERNSDDQWLTVIAGDTIHGDPLAMQMILRELRAMRAESFPEDNLENKNRYFADPAGSISVRFHNASPLEFVFSHPDSQRSFVITSEHNRISGVGISSLDVFQRSLEDLRDRRVLRFDAGSLGKITLETGALNVSIFRTGTDWSFANPTLGMIEQTEISGLMQSLENMKYREIIDERLVDPSAYGLDHPAYRLTLYDSNEQIVDEVVAGASQPRRGIRHATSHSSHHLGILDTELLEGIERTFEEFQLE